MDKIYEQGRSGGTWVVTEKVHGSNFSIKYDGKNYYCGKRSSWVTGPDNVFFNYTKVLEHHKNRIEGLYNHLKTDLKLEFDDLTLYGELCGGSYPHPEVKPTPGAIRVQKGVHYSPHNEFYVFDMALDNEIVNYDMVVDALEYFSFLFARPLFTGTIEECLEYSNEFQTTIPGELEFPEIENNICEGVVIKPNDVRFMGHSRVILKNKNSKWSETTKKKKVRTEYKFTDEGQNMLDALFTYITENRLKNVLSKEGKIDNKMFGLIMERFTEDIMKDFLKDNHLPYEALEKVERKTIQKRMATESSNMLRENFLNIMDGIFG
jgi:Rnl2 family RNA ligase